MKLKGKIRNYFANRNKVSEKELAQFIAGMLIRSSKLEREMIISETKNQLSKFKKSNLKSDKDVIYYERKEKEVEFKSKEIREVINIRVSDITNSLNVKELADELKISFNKFCEIAASLECPIKNPQGRIQAETHTRLFEFIQNRIEQLDDLKGRQKEYQRKLNSTKSKESKLSNKKKHVKSLSRIISVYDQIQLRGGVGKLIYNRPKN